MFDERKNIGIFFARSHIPGQPIKDEVRDGDSVVLHLSGERVLVRDVKHTGDSRFIGVIYGFEPSFGLEHQGLKVEQVVKFEENHIVSCSEA